MDRRVFSALALVGAAILLVEFPCSCDKPEASPEADGAPQADRSGGGEVAPAEVVPAETGRRGGDGLAVAEIATPQELLAELPPAGPQPPAPKGYTGTCPTFSAGPNKLLTDKRSRSLELWLPPHLQPGKSPLVFVWHGNGDTPKNIGGFFDAAGLAQKHNAVVVAPNDCCSDGFLNDCCDQSMTWNMGSFSKTAADLSFFDDLLSCLDAQYDIDNRRVYLTGFSAGALWNTFLVINRGEYLAAATIFSGGTGLVFQYATPAVKLPLLLAWGGTNDTFAGVVNFDQMMKDFSAKLQADGHFVIECNHGLGHTIPYGGAAWGNSFLLSHEWGMEGSPLAASGLSAPYPAYCTIPASR